MIARIELNNHHPTKEAPEPPPASWVKTAFGLAFLLALLVWEFVLPVVGLVYLLKK